MIYANELTNELLKITHITPCTTTEIFPVAIRIAHKFKPISIKIWNTEYYNYMILRGNEPYLTKRVLVLFYTNLPQFEKLCNLYPRKKNYLKSLPFRFDQLCQKICSRKNRIEIDYNNYVADGVYSANQCQIPESIEQCRDIMFNKMRWSLTQSVL